MTTFQVYKIGEGWAVFLCSPNEQEKISTIFDNKATAQAFADVMRGK